MALQETSQIYREAPFLEDYRRRLMESVFARGDVGQLPPEVKIAGRDPLETQAEQLATTGIGAYAPYLAAGQQQLSTAMDTTGAGVTQIAGTAAPTIAAGVTPAIAGMAAPTQAGLQQYMDPYQSLVTQQALEEIDRQGAMAQQSLATGATKAGAFGGARFGVAEAELARNLQDIKSRRVAEDQQKNYLQAMQTFQDTAKRQLYGGQLLGQLGQLQGTLGTNLGTLGQQQMAQAGAQAQIGQGLQALGGVDIERLSALGGQKRQLAQAELEAARQTQQQAIGEPYQRLGFISDVLSKVPSVQSSLVQATSPTTSPLAQAIGAFMGVGTGLGQLGGMFDWGSGGGGSQPPQTGNLQSNYGLGSLI